MKRFFRTHGETIFFAIVIVLALTVVGPTLDRYDAERAQTAQR